MPNRSFPDLASLAAHLRGELQQRRFVLVYGYNGTGKTRLSGAFKDLGKTTDAEGGRWGDTLYFNAFTEDLFNWNNDLDHDRHRVLVLNHRSQFFAGLATLELDTRIRVLLERYADFDFRIDSETDKNGNLTKAEVVFLPKSATGGDGIKISRGEESVFIWCFFLAILRLALDDDGTGPYKWVKFVYIDDPVSSLDEHNAIVVGNHLVEVFRESTRKLSAVVSTHHALFFNVVHYEAKSRLPKGANGYAQSRHFLKPAKEGGGYLLDEQTKDTPQFYHVSALEDLWAATQTDEVRTYHFNVLRSVLEKTAFFLGYEHFSGCLKEEEDGILRQRYVDILSHGKYSMYEPIEMSDDTREFFRTILRGFLERHPFNRSLFPGLTNTPTPAVAAPDAGAPQAPGGLPSPSATDSRNPLQSPPSKTSQAAESTNHD